MTSSSRPDPPPLPRGTRSVPAPRGPRSTAPPPIPEPPPEPRVVCSFCGRSELEGEVVLQGAAGWGCGTCILDLVPVVAARRPDGIFSGLDAIVAALPSNTPRPRSQPILDALFSEAVEADQLRTVARRALAIDQPPIALKALKAIPLADRTGIDWLDLAAAHGEMGDAPMALKIVRQVDPSSLSIVDQAVRIHNEVTYGLRAGENEAEDLVRYEEFLGGARGLLERCTPGTVGRDETLADVLATIAELAFDRGKPRRALVLLEEVFRLAPPRPGRLLLRGDVFEALGRLPEARAAWDEVAKSVQPDSWHAEAARQRLETKPS